MTTRTILLLSCPDRTGVVAAVAGFLAARNGNILRADQHQDGEHGLFLTRIEWDLDGFALSLDDFMAAFAPIAREFDMNVHVALAESRPRVALFVSRDTHCLVDLLYRQASGDVHCDIPLVISNHLDARHATEAYGIPFVHIPVDPASKTEAEARARALLDSEGIDLVVLARYMQILSPEFVALYPRRIINIHHSFLPAFAGSRPYHQAHARGVKLIGATAHYVTEDLDEGPIIEQDVTRVSHADTVDDLARKGRDLERLVLARAVRWHVEHRILAYANRTVVFE